MLSRDEERRLARLEESLREPAWRRVLRNLEAPVWRYRWKLRLLVCFGLVVLVSGLVTGSADVVDQGVLITLATSVYWALVFMQSPPGPPPDEEAGGRRGADRW